MLAWVTGVPDQQPRSITPRVTWQLTRGTSHAPDLTTGIPRVTRVIRDCADSPGMTLHAKTQAKEPVMTVQQQPAKPRNPRGTPKPAPAVEVDPIVIEVEYDSVTTNNLKYREPEPGEENPMFMPTVGTLYVRKPALAIAYGGKLPVSFTITLTPHFQ